jgi:hypothetical protein
MAMTFAGSKGSSGGGGASDCEAPVRLITRAYECLWNRSSQHLSSRERAPSPASYVAGLGRSHVRLLPQLAWPPAQKLPLFEHAVALLIERNVAARARPEVRAELVRKWR